MPDILIRGMEMPRQGLKVVAIHSNGHVYADTSDPGFLHKIADVIELPEHGDLIDIRTILEIVMQYVPDDDGSCSKANADLRELLDAIENAPAVVPAERREG